MAEYVVTTSCYVPVLGVGVQFKHAGEVVFITDSDAKKLDGYVSRAGTSIPGKTGDVLDGVVKHVVAKSESKDPDG